MLRTRSAVVAAALLLLALLPAVAAMSVPSTVDVRLGFGSPLATVNPSFRRAPPATASDIAAITAMGACLLGLAAVVRRTGS